MIPTSARPLVRMIVAGTVLAVALVVSGCSDAPSPSDMPALPSTGVSGAPGATPGAAPGATPATSPIVAVGADAVDLLAVGQSGQTRGVSEQVRTFGASIVDESQKLITQLQLAGAAVSPGVSPAVNSALQDLASRPGAEVDAAWLKLAGQEVQQLRDTLSVVSVSPDAPDNIKSSARDLLVRLDSLLTSLQGVAGPAGAAPPVVVAAGNGGQLAEESSASNWLALGGGGLFGLGVLMVGGAMFRRRTAG